jgi:glutaredoxin
MNPIVRAALEAYESARTAVLPRAEVEDVLARNGALCRETCEGVLNDMMRDGLLAAGVDASVLRRTEAGRLALAAPLGLTLYTRPGCHLCDEMKAVLEPLAREFGARVTEVNVDQADDLRQLYGNDVPVLFLGTRKAAKHRLDVRQMRRQLESARDAAS